jgi:hypothetical protein
MARSCDKDRRNPFTGRQSRLSLKGNFAGLLLVLTATFLPMSGRQPQIPGMPGQPHGPGNGR